MFLFSPGVWSISGAPKFGLHEAVCIPAGIEPGCEVKHGVVRPATVSRFGFAWNLFRFHGHFCVAACGGYLTWLTKLPSSSQISLETIPGPGLRLKQRLRQSGSFYRDCSVTVPARCPVKIKRPWPDQPPADLLNSRRLPRGIRGRSKTSRAHLRRVALLVDHDPAGLVSIVRLAQIDLHCAARHSAFVI
jgi:hypothetical protein